MFWLLTTIRQKSVTKQSMPEQSSILMHGLRKKMMASPRPLRPLVDQSLLSEPSTDTTTTQKIKYVRPIKVSYCEVWNYKVRSC